MLKIHRYFLQRKCRTKDQVFSDISLTVILAGQERASKTLTITRKWYKTVGKLVLITNRKSYISFRLVLKSVTLNDLDRCNGHYVAFFQRIW